MGRAGDDQKVRALSWRAFWALAGEDDKEATVFSRVTRWCAESIEYEADPRRAEKSIYALGLEGLRLRLPMDWR